MESKKGAARREKILAAARQQFGYYGYAGASMSRIAAAAGVTKAALYYHFPAKVVLFRETARQILESLNSGVAERAAGISDPLERLRALVHAHLDLFLERRELVVLLYAMMFLPEEATAAAPEIPFKCEESVREALAACAREGYLPEDQVDDLTTLLLGGVHHAGIKWLLARREPRPDARLGDRLLCRVMPSTAHRLSAAGVCPPKRVSGPADGQGVVAAKPVGRCRRAGGAMLGLLMPFLLWVAPTGPALATTAAGALPGRAPGPEPATRSTPTAGGGAGGTVVAIQGAQAPSDRDHSIREALAANAGLQAERERRGELKGLMTQALSTGLPTLDLNGTWLRSRDPSFAFDETFGGGGLGGDGSSALDSLFGDLSFLPAAEDIPAQTYWRTSLNAHWELSPSLIYNAVSAAGMGIERQELLVADAEHRTTEAVMAAYYSVIKAGEYVAALDADLAARSEFLDVTRRRFGLGLSTALDTLRAAVSLANLTPQRRRAAQMLRDTGARLNILMGRETLVPLAVYSGIPVETDFIDPVRAAARVHERPDIRQIDLFVGMLRKNRGARKAAHKPSLSADASYGYVTRDLDELTDKGHDSWSASLTLKVPLFDGLLTRGKVQEAEASIRRVRYEYEEVLRQARLEVLSLLGDLEAAHANLSASRLNLTAAEDALRQMTLRYELGKADYISVLHVQTERSLARRNLIQARNEVLTLTASLKRALGFDPTVPLAEVSAALSSHREVKAGLLGPHEIGAGMSGPHEANAAMPGPNIEGGGFGKAESGNSSKAESGNSAEGRR